MSKPDFTALISVRVPKSLLKAVKDAAEADDRTMGSWVRKTIRDALRGVDR